MICQKYSTAVKYLLKTTHFVKNQTQRWINSTANGLKSGPQLGIKAGAEEVPCIPSSATMTSGLVSIMLAASVLVLLVLAFGPAAGEDQNAVRRDTVEFRSNRSEDFSRADAWCPAVCPGCPACPSAPPCPRHVPPGYKLYEGLGYYKIHYEYKNWSEAKAACEHEGGYLAVINSEEEADLSVNFLLKYNIESNIYLHIGFLDVTNNGRYITVLDEALSSTGYEVWAPGEPNGLGIENCGSLKPNKGLNDELCFVERPFLCELFA